MSKTPIFAFLNYSRPINLICGNINALHDSFPNSPFIVQSDKDVSIPANIRNLTLTKNSGFKNVASAKNALLTTIKTEIIPQNPEYKDQIVFLIEDDVVINDVMVIHEYLDLFTIFDDLGLIFFGFGGILNSIFNKKAPRLKIIGNSGKIVIFSQIPCGSMMCFNTRINNELFDESLDHLELKEYVSRLESKKLLPFVGVFIDVNDSYDKITTVRCEQLRPKDPALIRKESNVLKERNIKYKQVDDLKIVIDYVKSKKL